MSGRLHGIKLHGIKCSVSKSMLKAQRAELNIFWPMKTRIAILPNELTRPN
jgi:hypothetical protein